MIEMQWVTAPLQTPGNVGIFQSYGTSYKLQFREVVERSKAGRVIIATKWQDVKIGESTCVTQS